MTAMCVTEIAPSQSTDQGLCVRLSGMRARQSEGETEREREYHLSNYMLSNQRMLNSLGLVIESRSFQHVIKTFKSRKRLLRVCALGIRITNLYCVQVSVCVCVCMCAAALSWPKLDNAGISFGSAARARWLPYASYSQAHTHIQTHLSLGHYPARLQVFDNEASVACKQTHDEMHCEGNSPQHTHPCIVKICPQWNLQILFVIIQLNDSETDQ